MSVTAFALVAFLGLLLGIAGFALMLLAGDPDGRTADLANWGVPCLLVGELVCIGFGIGALIALNT